MYKIKVIGIDTLVIDENANGVARFYGSDGLENAELFVIAKEKVEKLFVKDGKSVPQEY